MAEQEQLNNVSSQEQPQDETLEDVFRQFPVEQAANSFAAQPRQNVEQPPPDISVPDPSYDPDGFKNVVKSLHTNDWEVKTALNRVSEQLEGMKQERQRAAEEADISQTVKQIQDSVPALAGKEGLVKAYLGVFAQQDQRVLKVWENRKQNPAAWNKTLSVITKQMAKDIDFKADPQLTENTRAAKASRDQMATTRTPDADEKWAKASPSQFQHYWDELTKG